ncbi:MAG: hypothetical protein K8S94_01275 [Planctomycetia bacterium]|nr:hypothetical protein [Planctomycetia bacterium]
MGGIRDEWRRFRQRRLAPLFRWREPVRPAATPAVQAGFADETTALDPLLIALLRSELRRRAAFGVPAADRDALRRLATSGAEPGMIDQFVTAMLDMPDPARRGDSA